jgi:hypothetical protein
MPSEGWRDAAAKLIFHQDPARLPRRAVRKATAAGEFRPFLLLEFRADRSNFHAWVAGVLQDMWEGAEGFSTHEEARVALDRRVDESWTKGSFADLPPMLQAGFYRWAQSADG